MDSDESLQNSIDSSDSTRKSKSRSSSVDSAKIGISPARNIYETKSNSPNSFPCNEMERDLTSSEGQFQLTKVANAENCNKENFENFNFEENKTENSKFDLDDNTDCAINKLTKFQDQNTLFKNENNFDLNKEEEDGEEKEDREEEEEKNLVFRNKNQVTANDNKIIDLRQKLDAKKREKSVEGNCENYDHVIKTSGRSMTQIDDLSKKQDEDILDFEAEEGECHEISKTLNDNEQQNYEFVNEEIEKDEDLEEGEVSDEEEKRPEEQEPKPICRFYTRGACTWGMSCRFLHPGVTDKGNYTMFDMIRPVPVSSGTNNHATFNSFNDYRDRSNIPNRSAIHSAYSNNLISEHRLHNPAIVPNFDQHQPVIESAWERGLRTAKEMMRKANKRKEQDMDFEDKKMNLTLSPDDLEKDNYYFRDRASPENNLVQARSQAPYYGQENNLYASEPKIPMRITGNVPYDEVDSYGRTSRYRELPAHRMPQYEDERRLRPTREVIVQRIDPSGRGDEWSDPWMRSKSPGARDRDKRSIGHRERSYSSNSSCSTSSSSSRSGSSSDSSKSASSTRRKHHYNNFHSYHKSPVSKKHVKSNVRSPSSENKKGLDYRRRSSSFKKRRISPSLSPKRKVKSPFNKRKSKGSLQKRHTRSKTNERKKRGTSSSGSGSSASSGSESDSSFTSSSSSSSHEKTPVKKNFGRRTDKTRKDDEFKKRSPITIELKKISSLGASALSAAIDRDNNSNSSASLKTATIRKSTRREELLKQLRAVEDAIARKKSKLS